MRYINSLLTFDISSISQVGLQRTGYDILMAKQYEQPDREHQL